jgi:hypothetical protein
MDQLRYSQTTMSEAPRKSVKKKAQARAPKSKPQLEGAERFTILLDESEKFCESVGLHKDLIREIIKTDSDWAFILKIDALLERAAKYIVRTGLRIKLLNESCRMKRSMGSLTRGQSMGEPAF